MGCCSVLLKVCPPWLVQIGGLSNGHNMTIGAGNLRSALAAASLANASHLHLDRLNSRRRDADGSLGRDLRASSEARAGSLGALPLGLSALRLSRLSSMHSSRGPAHSNGLLALASWRRSVEHAALPISVMLSGASLFAGATPAPDGGGEGRTPSRRLPRCAGAGGSTTPASGSDGGSVGGDGGCAPSRRRSMLDVALQALSGPYPDPESRPPTLNPDLQPPPTLTPPCTQEALVTQVRENLLLRLMAPGSRSHSKHLVNYSARSFVRKGAAGAASGGSWGGDAARTVPSSSRCAAA